MAVGWLSKFRHTVSFSSDICFSPYLRAILVENVVERTRIRRGV